MVSPDLDLIGYAALDYSFGAGPDSSPAGSSVAVKRLPEETKSDLSVEKCYRC